MRSLFWRLVLALALSPLSLALAQPLPTSVVIAAEDDWAPYSSLKADKSGPEGFSPDLVRAVFALKGIKVNFVTVPFIRCLDMVTHGTAVACFNTTITDSNRDQYHWHTTPIFEEGLAVFALSELPKSGLDSRSLEGSTVGITRGYTYPTDFMQNANIKRTQANSDELLLKMLVARRVDYVILNTMPGLQRIHKNPSLRGKIKQVGLISMDGFWLNFSKVHPDGKALAQVFESGLLALKKSGDYDKMRLAFRQRMGLSN